MLSIFSARMWSVESAGRRAEPLAAIWAWDVLPTDATFSPSELDKLDDCPFVFLARHRLKLRAVELPDFEVSPLEIGTLAHRILREFYAVPVGDSEEGGFRKNAGSHPTTAGAG
jgi:ATP-dependent helicase/DNAse subunit B